MYGVDSCVRACVHHAWLPRAPRGGAFIISLLPTPYPTGFHPTRYRRMSALPNKSEFKIDSPLSKDNLGFFVRCQFGSIAIFVYSLPALIF